MKKIAAFIGFMFYLSTIMAQEQEIPAQHKSFGHFTDSLNKSKTGKKFPLHGRYSAIDGKTIDFDNLKHNAYLLFGEDGCPPCVKELKLMVDLSKEYTKIDFIYFCVASDQGIKEQLKDVNENKFYSSPNFFILQRTTDVDIRKNETILCYPTEYCIDRQNIIRSYDIGYKDRKFLVGERLCEINY
jgi:thiol-disulfide isomerase/thioredoxin